MQATRSTLSVGLALVLCLLAAPASAKSGHGQSTGAYNVPVAENKAWRKYRFDVGITNEQTSFRPAPPPYPADPNQPGSQGTVVSQVYDEDGSLIGRASWFRTVISNVDSLATRQLISTFEFGSEDDGFSKGAVSFTALTSRIVPDSQGFVSWNGIIGGGRGIFRGAIGEVTVVDATDFNDFISVSAVHRFVIYVPNDLP